jgi:hypothetical protein
MLLVAILWIEFESLPAQTALPPDTLDFASFLERYPLKPLEDYTFLGTEDSQEKPIVLWNGRIDQWFDPAERVPWVTDARAKGNIRCDFGRWFICRRYDSIIRNPMLVTDVK